MGRREQEPVPGTIGATIRSRREILDPKPTQTSIARNAGISKSYYSRLESGLVRNPNKEVIDSIAKELGCSPADLMPTGPNYRMFFQLKDLESLVRRVVRSELEGSQAGNQSRTSEPAETGSTSTAKPLKRKPFDNTSDFKPYENRLSDILGKAS